MKITSFLQACEILKYNPKTVLPNVSKMPMHLRAHPIARAKLEIIAEASRKGIELDYDDLKQRKWFGLFWMNKPGFRFFGSRCVIPDSFSFGGPRLCYCSEEESDWHCKEHIALYMAAFVIPTKKVKPKEK